MAIVHYENREIHCKIIYFGAKGSGKTTNLRSIYQQTSSDLKSGRFQLLGPAPRQGFGFLPLSLGYVEDYHVKVHLYADCASPFMPSIDKTLLAGVDGYVSVCDARVDAFLDNLNELTHTRKRLQRAGYHLGELPHVIQYNKVDLLPLVPHRVLQEELNPQGSLDCRSIATMSKGTMETLILITKQVLKAVQPPTGTRKGAVYEFSHT